MNHTATYPPKFSLPAMGGYRYFFNGQEADNEVLGEGASLTAEFWQYDTRLGRRWNVDPVFKDYESPYACFAGNPVRFADRFGADTVFNDNTARKNFLEAYQWIIGQIASVENEIASIRTNAARKGWDERKTNRKINRLNSMNDYSTLLEMKQGFEDIMTDPIVFTYSTSEDMIKDFTGGHTKHVDDLHVNVYFRQNKLGALIHETRHAWGVIRKEWSFRGGYDTFDELWAFSWQSVIDADGVNDFIDAATKYKFPNPDKRWALSLTEAVNYFYTEHLKTGMIKSNVPIPEPETLKKNIRKAGDYIRSVIGR